MISMQYMYIFENQLQPSPSPLNTPVAGRLLPILADGRGGGAESIE
jgi:hypothetical protein